MLNPGTIVAEKYRVERVLGRGAMGVVVEATHLELQQRVALKFLLAKLADEAALVERFVREARASAQLRGEHVCRVSDVGRGEDGVPYIVMELLDGGDLATLVETTGPLPIEVATEYVLQACVGVAEAHALGIVHRDLKPANLFLTERPDGAPQIKVLDFGIAKAPETQETFSLTQTSALLGSPAYMSPEQLRSSRTADVRGDIWQVGVILYELVAGRAPFVGATITELALHITLEPSPLLEGVPPEFAAVVSRCLEKEPEDRYADLAALTDALAPFGGPRAADYARAVARLLERRVTRSAPPVDCTSASLRDAARPGKAGACDRSPDPLRDAASPTAAVTVAMRPPIAPGPDASSTMTTFGGTASAVVSPASAPQRRRWGLIAGVASVTVILGAIAITALPSGGGSPRRVPAAASPPAASPPTAPRRATRPPAGVLRDAEPSPPAKLTTTITTTPPATTTKPARLTTTTTTTTVEQPVVSARAAASTPPPTPPTKATKPSKRPTAREDLGDSRY